MDQETLWMITTGLAALAVVLLIVLLILVCSKLRRQHRGQDDWGNTVMDELDAQRQDRQRTAQSIVEGTGRAMTNIANGQTALLESIQRQLAYSAREQNEQLNRSLTQVDTRLEQMRQQNDRQLTEMRKTVDEKLTETLDRRLTESFAQVSQRLEQVYKGLGEMQTLAAGVGDLKKVLTNVKTRGIWGEMQLGALLSQILSPEQYEANVAVIPGSSERVEYAVKLPGKGDAVVYLAIDSKFPQEDYMRLVDASKAGNAAATEEARKALQQALKTEAKRISGKYVKPPHTTDFAIMFLPVEGLYAEAVQSPELMESLQREQRVLVAGPSTFAALLNALQMGFRTLAIEKRSGEVWKLLRAVKQDFGLFADTLEKTQQRLRQASESIDSAFVRTRSIERRLGSMEEAGLTEERE